MTQRILLALILLAPLVASGEELARVGKPELATVLGFLDELATTPPGSDQPYTVRVYAVPTSNGECDGTVASCPDVRLLVSVSNGDLGETPVLYQLPLQKGWEFQGWAHPARDGRIPKAGFVVRTTLPDGHIEPAARRGWHAQEYRVSVSPESASYVRRPPAMSPRAGGI